MTVEMQSRRRELQQVVIHPTTHAHAGLWLDKYLEYQVKGGGDNAKKPHFEKVVESRVPPAYVTFFEQWQDSLEKAGAVARVAQAQGRLAIGLGGESVLETAITLHRTYGVPYIPGSALKGLAARYARNRLDEETWGKDKNAENAYKILFGDTTGAGYVTFFDALYIPGSIEEDRPLALDVITVHHPEYYRGENSPPADWDNPNPIPFLSTTGSYLIVLHGAEGWVKAAFETLELALAEEGIGAKTSSGYGRMSIEDVTTDKDIPDVSTSVATMDLERATVASFLLRLEQIPHYKVAGEIHSVYQMWLESDVSEASKRKMAQAILDKVESAGRTKKSARKNWFKELQRFVVEHISTKEG